MAAVWEIAQNCLEAANKKVPIRLHAFILMNNHYHMLLTTPDENIDRFMHIFNKTFSEQLKENSNFINRMFGGPYKWSIIDSTVYLYNVYRYIYQNPLRAKICEYCELYPYSTLFYQHNNKKFAIPITDRLEHDPKELIQWFNEKFSDLQRDGLRRGLKHKYCQVNKTRDSKLQPSYSTPQHPQKDGVPKKKSEDFALILSKEEMRVGAIGGEFAKVCTALAIHCTSGIQDISKEILGVLLI